MAEHMQRLFFSSCWQVSPTPHRHGTVHGPCDPRGTGYCWEHLRANRPPLSGLGYGWLSRARSADRA